jgi:TM2 domain-containing membrane protein YozV
MSENNSGFPPPPHNPEASGAQPGPYGYPQQGVPAQPGYPAGMPQDPYRKQPVPDPYQAQGPYQQQVPPAYQQDQYQQGQYPEQVPPQGYYGQPHPGYQLPAEQKSKLVAGLLGIFLGSLGIHRFYLGHTTIGVIQLLLTIFVGFFTFGLVGLWGFVEGIMILCGAQMFRADAKGIPLRD